MGYHLRSPKQNLTHCPGWVEHYKVARPACTQYHLDVRAILQHLNQDIYPHEKRALSSQFRPFPGHENGVRMQNAIEVEEKYFWRIGGPAH